MSNWMQSAPRWPLECGLQPHSIDWMCLAMANTHRKSEWVRLQKCKFRRKGCWCVCFFLREVTFQKRRISLRIWIMHEFSCCARRCHENKRHDKQTLSQQWNTNEWIKPHLWMTCEPDIRFGGRERCHACDFSSKSTYTHTNTRKYMYSNAHSRILAMIGDPRQHVGPYTQSMCMWAVFFQRTVSTHLVVPHPL